MQWAIAVLDQGAWVTPVEASRTSSALKLPPLFRDDTVLDFALAFRDLSKRTVVNLRSYIPWPTKRISEASSWRSKWRFRFVEKISSFRFADFASLLNWSCESISLYSCRNFKPDVATRASGWVGHTYLRAADKKYSTLSASLWCASGTFITIFNEDESVL